MPDKPQPGQPADSDAARREARLAARLRANLARRKQQGRARAADGMDAGPDAADAALDRGEPDA